MPATAVFTVFVAMMEPVIVPSIASVAVAPASLYALPTTMVAVLEPTSERTGFVVSITTGPAIDVEVEILNDGSTATTWKYHVPSTRVAEVVVESVSTMESGLVVVLLSQTKEYPASSPELSVESVHVAVKVLGLDVAMLMTGAVGGMRSTGRRVLIITGPKVIVGAEALPDVSELRTWKYHVPFGRVVVRVVAVVSGIASGTVVVDVSQMYEYPASAVSSVAVSQFTVTPWVAEATLTVWVGLVTLVGPTGGITSVVVVAIVTGPKSMTGVEVFPDVSMLRMWKYHVPLGRVVVSVVAVVKGTLPGVLEATLSKVYA